MEATITTGNVAHRLGYFYEVARGNGGVLRVHYNAHGEYRITWNTTSMDVALVVFNGKAKSALHALNAARRVRHDDYEYGDIYDESAADLREVLA